MTEDAENTMKGLLRLNTMARKAKHGAATLADKIRFNRLEKTTEGAYNALALAHFDIEDAEVIAATVEICKECGGLK